MFQKRNDLELLEAIRKQPAHVRALAKRTNLSAATTMRLLRQLENQAIIKSSKEGKNLRYSLRDTLETKIFIQIVESYKLLKLLQTHSRIVEELQTNTNGELIIIFGSVAKGTATKQSDIDVYVETNNPELKGKLRTISPKLSIQTGSLAMHSPLAQEMIRDHAIVQNTERWQQLIQYA